jgi:hypothetical protein
VSWGNTGHTQKNGAVSSLKPLKPHHSFVYALYYARLKTKYDEFPTVLRFQLNAEAIDWVSGCGPRWAADRKQSLRATEP